jgi:uncharacterized repeat protein (TIGR01451 family)
VTLTNTILVSHSVGISVDLDSSAYLEGTLWGSGEWANETDWVGPVYPGTVNIWGDPAFLAPDTGDYHLGPGSEAIDAGVDAGVTVDFDGEPRPLPPDGDYDIGADEFFPSPSLTVSKQASPDLVQAGEPLTYTLHVTNTGNVDLHATVTEVLPAHVTPGGLLTWTPTVTAPGGTWTQQVVVAVETGYSGNLTNVVQVATDEGATGVYTATSMATGHHHLYLPLVLKNH